MTMVSASALAFCRSSQHSLSRSISRASTTTLLCRMEPSLREIHSVCYREKSSPIRSLSQAPTAEFCCLLRFSLPPMNSSFTSPLTLLSLDGDSLQSTLPVLSLLDPLVIVSSLPVCGGQITSGPTPGLLHSQASDAVYGQGTTCRFYFPSESMVLREIGSWRISSSSPSKAVSLSFTTFHIEADANCQYDYVKVFDGEKEDDDRLLGLFCGDQVSFPSCMDNPS